MRSGIKTTEFWLTALLVVAGGVLATGVHQPEPLIVADGWTIPWDQITATLERVAAIVATAIAVVKYLRSRTEVKQAELENRFDPLVVEQTKDVT